VVLKDIHKGVLSKCFSRTELMSYLTKQMTEHKLSTVEKTFSILTSILNDFNIISAKKDPMKNETIYTVNDRLRPTNETVAFSLYYEFFEVQDNRIPNAERLPNADTFKYLLIDRFLIDRYIKWLI